LERLFPSERRATRGRQEPTPEYLAQFVVDEIARWAIAIKANGLQVDYAGSTASTLFFLLADEVTHQSFCMQCMSPLMAQSGHYDRADSFPLSGVKRTSVHAVGMSAYDSKRTFARAKQ
jgi:hypothetical protein